MKKDDEYMDKERGLAPARGLILGGACTVALYAVVFFIIKKVFFS